MDFIYFKGLINDMSDLLDGKHKCSICDLHHDNCFDLEFSITDKFNPDDKNGKIGCYECLRKGEFEFWHDIEYGVLDENGLSQVYNHNITDPPNFRKAC